MIEMPANGAYADLNFSRGKYGLLITRGDVDRYEHHALFARELVAAMQHHRVPMRCLDYLREAPDLFTAMRDPDCGFAICFNGFGSELTLSGASPTSMCSLFAAVGKPLLDFMHDCPAHDTMKHQVASRCTNRILLLTDHGYASLAVTMGFPNVHYVPSITFPVTAGGDVKPISDRSISILLPVGLSSPDLVSLRFVRAVDHKNRVYSTLFEAVTSAAVSDWQVDPVAELLKIGAQLDCGLDFRSPDARFLLTAVVDYVKLARRRRLLRALAHLPITIITDQIPEDVAPGGAVRFECERSATELLRVMGDSKCVICPTPHMTGFHERVLGAFTAGAVVVSAPNTVVETNFVVDQEYLHFHDETQLAVLLDAVLRSPQRLQTIADSGRAHAMSTFHPDRLALIFLSLLATRGV